MQKSLLTVVTATVLAAASFARAAKPSTVVGELKLHTLKFNDADRTIRVWLPAGYDAAGDARYPVLYMHDGQNLFDNATSGFGEWKIDETVTALARNGEIDPPIVVGIDNGGDARIAELTYTQDHGRGGNGAQYEQFVMATVVPFVEKTYRVRADRASTIIGGSSLGGTMSLELAMRHPDTFGKAMIVSPSLWWDRQSLLREVATGGGILKQTTIYLDIGEREGSEGPSRAQFVQMARTLDALLTSGQIAHHFAVDPIGEHNEASWSRRFPAAIRYLLPPRDAAATQPTPTTAPANPG